MTKLFCVYNDKGKLIYVEIYNPQKDGPVDYSFSPSLSNLKYSQMYVGYTTKIVEVEL